MKFLKKLIMPVILTGLCAFAPTHGAATAVAVKDVAAKAAKGVGDLVANNQGKLAWLAAGTYVSYKLYRISEYMQNWQSNKLLANMMPEMQKHMPTYSQQIMEALLGRKDRVSRFNHFLIIQLALNNPSDSRGRKLLLDKAAGSRAYEIATTFYKGKNKSLPFDVGALIGEFSTGADAAWYEDNEWQFVPISKRGSFVDDIVIVQDTMSS